MAKFNCWLNDKLRELKTDESVLGPYIIGILEGDESYEEKVEVIEGILGEIIGANLNETINEIIEKWKECLPKADAVQKPTVDVDKQLAKMLENQKLQTIVQQRVYTPEELRIREQILAQYSQTEVSDEEDDLAVEDGEREPSGIAKNTNASDVMQLQKDRREQAKLDSQKKKDKDKEDREKQKQMREEKKEKRKTVKGERRR